MIEYSSTPEFFFLDEMSDGITSVSVGEVWLYFYKQTLIGVRDMRNNRAVFLRVTKIPKPDGYSHRHEITYDIVLRATKEPYHNQETPKYLHADELTALAIAWVAEGLTKHVDLALHA